MAMELDNRKLRVLAAIVETYIATGEPVGSKLVTYLLGGGVSSATVRNDMAVLYEMGLLEQPHTSAGRVPSHLGYRMYIDRIMQQKPLSQEEKDQIEAIFNLRDPDPERLLSDAAQVLAKQTKYATISTTFTSKKVKVKRIELIPAGHHTLVIILISDTGIIKSKIVRVSFEVTPKVLEFFQTFANGRFGGLELSKITTWYVNSMAMSLGEYTEYFNQLLTAIYDLCREASEAQFYTSGSANILAYSEIGQMAQELFGLFDRRQELVELAESADGDIHITIGRENARAELTGSSVVMSRFHIGEIGAGAIGVIGPVRMDYAKIIPHLEYFAEKLGELLSEMFEET